MFLAGASGWIGASHRDWSSSLLQGKWVILVPWWRKEHVYPAKLPLIQDISAQAMRADFHLFKFSYTLMNVAGSSAGGVFKHSTHVTSCSQERHFLKLWLIYGGVGACIMPVHFSSWSQYTHPFLLFTSDHKHMRRLRSAFARFYFCFLYSPYWLSNLLDCPRIIFPQNPFSWCPLVPPAFFWGVFPPAFSAALSQHLSHAVQLLSLVLHPRFSHLAIWDCGLGHSHGTQRGLYW